MWRISHPPHTSQSVTKSQDGGEAADASAEYEQMTSGGWEQHSGSSSTVSTDPYGGCLHGEAE